MIYAQRYLISRENRDLIKEAIFALQKKTAMKRKIVFKLPESLM